MDTRYWGPSGWKLLHMIAYNYKVEKRKEFEEFFFLLPFILPCKFCRKSLQEYYDKDPPNYSTEDQLSRWLYRIHNKVNNKLRSQGQPIKKNPTYESVRLHPKECSEVEFPGWDFLFSIAETHPSSKLVKTSKPIPGALTANSEEEKNRWNLLTCKERVPYFERFWKVLPDVLPYEEWRKMWKKDGLDLTDRPSLLKSLWKIRRPVEKYNTFQGVCQTLKDQRSGCGVSNRGKTCRKKKTGK